MEDRWFGLGDRGRYASYGTLNFAFHSYPCSGSLTFLARSSIIADWCPFDWRDDS